MATLLDHMGPDLWEIVLDLLTFYHECCITCQPYEDGEAVWLSEEVDILESLQDIVAGVCRSNDIPVPKNLDNAMVAEAFDETPTSCSNCGAEWDSSAQIGGEWLLSRGSKTEAATYLLTKAYWSYLTHYTKPADGLSGLKILLKIVWDKRIRASDRMIAGKRQVVAFTECSPLEINALLEGETHPEPAEAFRWRRSKHGIAITREALCEAGALPVIHGDSRIREVLPDDQVFRFQKFDRKTAFSDWTFEREFRTERDVRLIAFNPSDIILIIANKAEMFDALARRNVPPFPVMPFNYVFSTDAPSARRTRRQQLVDDYFPNS